MTPERRMSAETDDDGYPTEAALQRLEAWTLPEGVTAWLDYAASLWHWPDFGVSRDISAHEAGVLRANPGERYLRLATGGWSGNEDVIGTMEQNRLLWALSWRLTARGGLHIFQYPTNDPEAQS